MLDALVAAEIWDGAAEVPVSTSFNEITAVIVEPLRALIDGQSSFGLFGSMRFLATSALSSFSWSEVLRDLVIGA